MSNLIVCPVCYVSNLLKDLTKPFCHQCSADLTAVVAAANERLSLMSDKDQEPQEEPEKVHGIYNCDWLSFTLDFEHYQAFFGQGKQAVYNPDCNAHLHRLFCRLDEEREKPEGEGFVDLGMWSFKVMTHGSKSYYYLLHNDDMEIRLARFRSRQEEVLPVFVHFKAQFLWSTIYGVKSLREKFDLVIEWLEQVLNGKYITSKINRLDLAYHCDNVPGDLTADHFVGKHTLDNTRRTHRIVSGVDIGSRRSEMLFLRCYNKYLEARATKKAWFFKIWEEAGLNIRRVWNIEFQCDREFFSELRLGRRRLDTVEETISNIPAIWGYLTQTWITYRIPDNPRRTRWSVHPWWEELSDYLPFDQPITRERQKRLPTKAMLIPAIRGYLTAYAARSGGSISDGTLWKDLFDEIMAYESEVDKDFLKDVFVKRQLLDPEDLSELAERTQELSDIEDELWRLYKTGEIDLKPDLMQKLSDQGLVLDKIKRDAATSLEKDPQI